LRPRTFRRFVLVPIFFAALAVVAFAIAPVQAAQPPQANPAWGDITSVVAGPGLTGGATDGDATLAAAFGGNGSANTVARSDHNHDDRYLRLIGGTLSGNLSAPTFTSTAPNGTAPFQVASGTVVTNFNADKLDGHDASEFALASQVGGNFDNRYLQLAGGALTGDLTLAMGDLSLLGANAVVVAPRFRSTVADGTAPFQVASSTLVSNLNADLLDGHHASDFAPATINFDDRYAPIGLNFDDRYAPIGLNFDDRYAPIGLNFDDRYAPIGINFDDRYLQLTGGTLSGNLSAPQVASTAPDGTAPFQVGSQTVVANLNADRLDGHDASDFALASQVGGSGDVALLGADNAFSGSNTFNGATTFGGSLNLATGGASFGLQPFYTNASAYSLRLIDTHAGATRFVIDQNGRVGIGTTSPGFPLHVVGDIRASNLNLGTAVLGPLLFDMPSSSDRTFSVTNSGTGTGNLSVEGTVSAAGISVATGNGSARAGNDAIASGATSRTVSTTAVGAASLIFVTADASRAGCAPVTDPLYVGSRSAGASFSVVVAGPAPAAGQTYCFNWWVVN